MPIVDLCRRAIAHYAEFEATGMVVPGSLPVLYFGNAPKYLTSSLRVITVGLNPSPLEFGYGRFPRFDPKSDDLGVLKVCLDEYFQRNPYTKWFNPAFESLLQPLGASYYGDFYPGNACAYWAPQPNTALHTDICTPLATSETWSNIDHGSKRRLLKEGFPLWRDLIRELQPHLILISVARKYRDFLGGQWAELYGFSPKKQSETLLTSRYESAIVVWGFAMNRPFGALNLERRRQAAESISNLLGQL